MADGKEDLGKKHRRMRHLLLNRRFQLKYTAMIIGVASVVSIVLGIFLMSTVRESSRMLKLEAEFDAVLQSQLADADAHIALVLIGSILAFNVVLALLAVFVTHRMAGPVFVMTRYVHELGEGKLPKVRKLRKGDEFGELVDEIAHTVTEMEARTRGEVAKMEKVLGLLSAEESTAAANARVELATLVEEKRGILARFEDP